MIRGLRVNETLTLAKVDLSTGNINFDGSLHIKGDVADGVAVDVSGSVLVEGVVARATIVAGGDIVIKNGIIGGAKKETDPEDDLEQESSVAAFGAFLETKKKYSSTLC